MGNYYADLSITAETLNSRKPRVLRDISEGCHLSIDF